VDVMVNESITSKYTIDEDKEIAEICKDKKNEESLLMMISMRLGLSENIAEMKFKDNPFDYLNIRNDFLKLITKREIEKEILELYKDPIYLKIIEISKNIQVKFLEKYVKDIKIGYLFGKGTFSHEVITQNLRGIHIPYENIDKLRIALIMKDIDFIIIPTYNSLIGEIYSVDLNRKVVGSIDHKIELCLYSNCENRIEYDTLYIEPHILKECQKYVDKLKVKQIEIVKSSVEGCIRLINNSSKCLTISSKNNESNFLNTLDSNIVDHNITTFSLIQ
jgi:chorismate mutase